MFVRDEILFVSADFFPMYDKIKGFTCSRTSFMDVLMKPDLEF